MLVWAAFGILEPLSHSLSPRTYFAGEVSNSLGSTFRATAIRSTTSSEALYSHLSNRLT